MVLLPDPDSPVNQSVAPFCLSKLARSSRVTCPSCQVMLVAFTSAISMLRFCQLSIVSCQLSIVRGPLRRPTIDDRQLTIDYSIFPSPLHPGVSRRVCGQPSSVCPDVRET